MPDYTVGWLQADYDVPIEGTLNSTMIATHGCPACLSLLGLADVTNVDFFIPIVFTNTITGVNPIEVLIGTDATATRDNFIFALQNYWTQYSYAFSSYTTDLVPVTGDPRFTIDVDVSLDDGYFDVRACSDCINLEQVIVTDPDSHKLIVTFTCNPSEGDELYFGALPKNYRAVVQHKIDGVVEHTSQLYNQFRVTNQTVFGAHTNDLDLNKSQTFTEDVSRIIRDHVSTPTPKQSYGTTVTFAPNITRQYSVFTYGTYAGEGNRLGSFSDLLGEPADVRIINACCENGNIDMSAYCGENNTEVKFLYDRGSDFTDDFCAGETVHFYLDLIEDGASSFYQLLVNGAQIDLHQVAQTGIHIFEVVVPTGSMFTVEVRKGTVATQTLYSETLTFNILPESDEKCCCNTPTYFLNKYGAFQKIRTRCYDNITLSVNTEFVDIKDTCSTASPLFNLPDFLCYDCLDLSGKYPTATITTKVHDLFTHKIFNTEENRAFLARFIESSEYYIYVDDCLEQVDLNIANLSFNENANLLRVPLQFSNVTTEYNIDSAVSLLGADASEIEIPTPVIFVGTPANVGGDPACNGSTFNDNDFPNSGVRSFPVSAILDPINVSANPQAGGSSYWTIGVEDTTNSVNYGLYAVANGADMSQLTFIATADPNTLTGNEYTTLAGGTQIVWDLNFTPYFAQGDTLQNGSTVSFDKVGWANTFGRMVFSAANGVTTGAASLKWTFILTHNDQTSNTSIMEMPIYFSQIGVPWSGIQALEFQTVGYPENVNDATLLATNDNTLVRWATERGWQINVQDDTTTTTNFAQNLANDCIETDSEHILRQLTVDAANVPVVTANNVEHRYPDYSNFMENILVDVNANAGTTFSNILTHPLITGELPNHPDPIFEQWITLPTTSFITEMIIEVLNESNDRNTKNCIAPSNQGDINTYGRIWAYIFENIYYIH